MRLDLNLQLINVNGEEFKIDGKTSEDNLLSKILGNLLFSRCDELGDAVKYNSIGEELYKKGYIEIDDSDLEKIIRFVETFKPYEGTIFPGYVRAQIIKTIKNTQLNAALEKNRN